MGQSEVSIRDLTIQPNSINFRKPFIKPWNKTSLNWTLFSDKLQGTLIYTDGSKMNNRSSRSRSHDGAFRAGNRPTQVHGGRSGPHLYLGGVAVVIRSFCFERPRAGRNHNSYPTDDVFRMPPGGASLSSITLLMRPGAEVLF
ncbi:hypothetical protein CDAR_312611 [Caerostris darwini]|uniref:Uncharacterized protein n=1 Tax=Caerostris darwini TaxID=1538125 RepID=A0AAV4MD80_9ARAC|nr:hypothetical protein CDAR_312611 [Caerostris darwini]